MAEGEGESKSKTLSISSREYPGNLTSYVILTSLAAAMGGAMFGYAIGVTGGVTSMAPFLKKFFPKVYRKQEQDHSTNQYCKFNSQTLTLFTSSQYLAALCASFAASPVTKRFGRKVTMGAGGFISMLGSALNSSSVNLAMSIVGQILSGFGLGFVNQSVPVYLSEMAPHKYRGLLGVMFQLSTTIGILLANVINFATAKIHGGWGWRLSLGLAALPAAIVFFSSFVLPETPSCLIEMGKCEDAKLKLKRIRGVDDVEAEYEDLVAASEASKRVKVHWTNFFSNRSYRPQLCLASLIPFFQQMTGINVVMFYAPELFRTLGFGGSASLLSSLITGIVNLAATIIAAYGVDRVGRKPLFLLGGVIMLIFQVVVAALIGANFGTSGVSDPLSKLYSGFVVTCICLFVAAFAISWGPLGWLVPSEISPLEIRSTSQSVTVAINMFFMFAIGQSFLSLLCAMKFWLFVFFATFVLVMTAFVFFFVPETKNIPIDEISELWKSHWFWRRYTNDGRSKGPKVCIEEV